VDTASREIRENPDYLDYRESLDIAGYLASPEK